MQRLTDMTCIHSLQGPSTTSLHIQDADNINQFIFLSDMHSPMGRLELNAALSLGTGLSVYNAQTQVT